MRSQRTARWLGSFALLLLLLLLLAAGNLVAGSVSLSPEEVLRCLLTGDRESTAGHILWDIRAPRLLAALVLGGALSAAGFLLQTFFANPIAGPFVLGVSSGAKLAVALLLVFTLDRAMALSSAALIAAAFVGAMAAMGVILLLSQRVRGMSLLVVCGVMIGYICSAVTELVVTFADDANIVNLHNWSMGSFSGMTWGNVGTMCAVVFPALGLAVLLSKPMTAYQMGEGYARSVGVDLKRFRLALILLSSLLSACVTAFAGPISFVGIAVPHLMKTLFGTARPLVLLPASFLGGGAFCLLCDLLARTLFAPTELSISTVTAVFGAPIVLWMLLSAQKGRERT
jgi:iron complex transport system permease protein